ncbi:MAG: DegV family protein [Chloroflexi bacterium]|nr:DegV family protein [Chloroflexota bacterium]
MSSTCILTDNAIQFTKACFSDDIAFLFLDYKASYSIPSVSNKSKTQLSDFPKQLLFEQISILVPPSNEEISEIISSSINSYDDVFILLHSKQINPIFQTVTDILGKMHGRASIHLIDTQSISVGQGYIIQYAHDLISKNIPGFEIDRLLRETIPHIYTLICSPNLSYLYASGFCDIGQCVVGEMTSLLPIFGFESGKLNSLEKVKNIRGVIEYFIEYIGEFADLLQVSFLQTTPPMHSESKVLRQFIEDVFPTTNYSEHPINNYLTSRIGPKGFGLIVIEKSS